MIHFYKQITLQKNKMAGLDENHPLHPKNQLGGLHGGNMFPMWLTLIIIFLFLVGAAYIVNYLLKNPVGKGRVLKVAGKKKRS